MTLLPGKLLWTLQQVTDSSKGSTKGIAVLEFGVQVNHNIVCSYMAHKFCVTSQERAKAASHDHWQVIQ